MSSMLKNSQSFLANLTANQGSAPKRLQKSFNCLISYSSRYCFFFFVDLHSIANLLVLLPAIKSGPGYFIEPEPALLMVAHPFAQNKCNNSLSAFEPFCLTDILNSSDMYV